MKSLLINMDFNTNPTQAHGYHRNHENATGLILGLPMGDVVAM